MSKMLALLPFLFGITQAGGFVGIGNQVFEVGITPVEAFTASIGYGLDYEPAAEMWEIDGPTYVNHFLARLHNKVYKKENFSVSWGLSLFASLGFHGSSHEDRGAVGSLFFEPEYMITDRIGTFATCNAASYILESPNGRTADIIDLSPDVNLGFRLRFGR